MPVGLVKRITRNDRAQAVLGWMFAQYIRFVHATSRWTEVGGDVPRRFWAEKRPYIGCFWHGRMMLMPYCRGPGLDFKMLISRHRDGRLISRTVSHFGIGTIEGSSSRGGAAAVRAMVRAIRDGELVGVTPDGPRGPRMRVGPGLIVVARITGTPILPASYSVRRRKVLASWDRFIVALPFNRGTFRWGTPITVAADADDAEMERARLAVEEQLNRLSHEADRDCGVPPIEPAAAQPGPGAPA
ncbi:MAG: lysophospholipid acyltransferase family protein [Alphaproteobacteria bacterium]